MAGGAPEMNINELFDLERIPSSTTNFLLLLYFPIGLIVFVFRLFMGVHTFLVACLLRKSTYLRSIVMPIMCAVLGILVRQRGARSKSVKIMCANHVSVLDHLAIDLVEPCILPSVWDIPSLVRWCFGYADLGGRVGRSELVKQTKAHIATEPSLPLLTLPEGAVTSGKKALLKFNTWPMEVSSYVQPVSLRIWRPFDVRSSHLGASWLSDLFWFLALPFTVISIEWLPVLSTTDEEPVEDFAKRVALSIAENLEIQTSNLTSFDASDAAKRFAQRAAVAPVKKRVLDPRRLDEVAMRIKQSHPSVPLIVIRQDLEKTRNQSETIEHIKTGQISPAATCGKLADKTTHSPADWRKVFVGRKWDMIETNRAKYLGRMKSNLAASGDLNSES